MPYHMMKPSALELMKHGRKDYADVERYCANPKEFLGLLDRLGVERAGLINYVAPKIIGFTPEVNDWSAKYCKAAPDRLIAFGGVLPGTVPEPCDAVHLRTWIRNRPGKYAAERDQAVRRCFAVLCAPIIYFGRESDYLWRDVIDQPRSLNAETVHERKQSFWIGRIALHFSVVLWPAFHRIER